MTIGIVDDAPGILDLIATTLQLAGYSTSSHRTGDSLLEALFSSSASGSGPIPYDLVIVDLLLPGSPTGVEVIQQIRDRVPTQQLPIVLLTAGGPGTIENAAPLLPRDVVCLLKPFYPRALVDTVRRLLTKQ